MATQDVTVGGELLRFRRQKGISQFDLAVCMDWKGTNPIIQIEKGRRLPRQDTINRLGECLGLTYQEVHYLQGLAGYVLPTRLPPPDQIIRTLETIAARLVDVPFPATVLDYQFRCWVFNPASLTFTGGDVAKAHAILSGPLDVLQMVFDSRLSIRGLIQDIETTEKEMVFTYKASNALRQHEAFYRTVPQRLAAALLPDDYRAFMRIWNAVDLSSPERLAPLAVTDFYGRMDQGDIQLAYPEGTITCSFRQEQILHLGDLFRVMTFIPVETPENRALAERVFANQTPPEMAGKTLKLWELIDIQTLYSEERQG